MASPGKLIIQYEQEAPSEANLPGDVTTVGRETDNDIVLADGRVSRHHARLTLRNGQFILTDLKSANGTWVDGKPVQEQVITPGCAFVIGRTALTLVVARSAPTMLGPEAASGATVSVPFGQSTPATSVHRVRLDRPVLTLGRDPACDIVLNNPAVSRLHAEIRRSGPDVAIFDLKSTNGTYVNGQPVTLQQRLKANDEIRIASYKIVFDGAGLAPVDESGNMRIDVLGLKKVVGKGVSLLNDIFLSIPPRDFVAIVGVSGAGKSTLLDALNGFRPGTGGAVMINGVNLYQNFSAYRSQLGYVPQDDIIHRELSVYDALKYAAELRMPADTGGAERHQRIMEVLEDLNMTPAKDRAIARLSGGQRKRVSIGVELLTRPSLFFLDEATSGLDPGTEGQLMQLLARLADQGRTIMLVTHATKNVSLCDKVIFLAKGGNLAYYGPPHEALSYFGVQDFDQIYTRIEQELSPQEWGNRYRQSQAFQTYVDYPLRQAGQAATAPAPVTHQPPAASARRASALRQLAVLSRRNLNITVRDKASLALMLLIAPLIGVQDFILWPKKPFSVADGNAAQGITMLFMMALICILVGSVASMREIVKETEIYRRERMVVLRIVPYVMSKVWVGVLLALYQAGVFVAVKRMAVGWPLGQWDTVATFVTLFLATLSGMMFGLLISAASPNQNVAPLMLILVMVPQFMFAGAMMPLSTFGAAGKVMSYVTSTKWAFESLVTVSKLGYDVAVDPCWKLPAAQRDALSESERQQCTCMGAGLFRTCDFPGIQTRYDPLVDTPEPVQPARPGDAPAQPARPTPPAAQSADAQKLYQDALQRYQQQMDAFQLDMEKYQSAARLYQDNMESWRVRYQDWKAKHDRAINEAEGYIEKISDDYGSMFKVNLALHWGWLLGLTVVLFGLILVMQRLKD